MATFTGAATMSTTRALKGGFGGNLIVATSTYNLTAALTSGQVIQMIPVPKGARIYGTPQLGAGILDTAATGAISLNVGDGGDVDRFVAASTVGRSGVTTASNAALLTGLAYQYTADDTIDVHVQAAPTTGATTGTITLQVAYEAE